VFRHIVLLTLNPDATDEDHDRIVQGLAELPAAISAIRSYTIGRDAKLNDGNADICVVADFDDASGYLVYRDHPAHVEVIQQRILPVLASRCAIQHEIL
jgi:hypothetical protein